MAPNKRKTHASILAVLALVGAALVSGCAGLGDDNDANRAPSAEIDADKTDGWAGEEFTFDAQDSTDADGEIQSWEFDFGDGAKETVNDEDAARVKHAYTDGGEYVVTVTVVDDGTQDGLEEKSDEDSIHVAVDERMPVAASVVKTPLNQSSGERMALPFDAEEGADRARVNVTVQNILLAGASEVQLRLIDPDGDVLEEKTVSLAEGESKDIDFDASLDDTGSHTFEVVASSGSARVTGDLEVIYSDAVDVDKATAET